MMSQPPDKKPWTPPPVQRKEQNQQPQPQGTAYRYFITQEGQQYRNVYIDGTFIRMEYISPPKPTAAESRARIKAEQTEYNQFRRRYVHPSDAHAISERGVPTPPKTPRYVGYLQDMAERAKSIHAQAERERIAQEMAKQARLQEIGDKLRSGQELDILDYIFMSKNYPDVTKQWQQQMNEQQKIEAINQKLAAGEPLDILEAITVSKNYPEVAKRLATESGINLKLETGEPLDILEAIFLSKNYPKVAKDIATQTKLQQQLDVIHEKLTAGESLDILDAITLSRQEPKLAKHLAQVTAFNTQINQLNWKLGSGETLDILDYITISKYAPDIAKQMNIQMQKQGQLETIKQKMVAGEPIDILEAITIATEEPLLVKQVAQISAFNTRVNLINEKLIGNAPLDVTDYIFLSKNFPDITKQWQKEQQLIERTNLKLETGQPLDILEAITIAKYAPDIAKSLAAPKGMVGGYTVSSLVALSTTPPPEYYESNILASTEFYEKLGHPELARKGYVPFQIPAGFQVKTMTATDQGLQISFEAIPASYQQQHAYAGTPTPLDLKREEYRIASFIAPIVVSARQAQGPRLSDQLYDLMRQWRKAEVFLPHYFGQGTPSHAYHIAGGLAENIESGMEMFFPYPVPIPDRPHFTADIFGWKVDLPTPERAFGYVLGTILTGAVTSYVFQAQLQYLSGKLAEKGSAWLTPRYQEALEQGNALGWKGWKETLVMKLTGGTPKGLAPSVVGFPTLTSVEDAATALSYEELAGARGLPTYQELATVPRGLGTQIDISIQAYKELPSLIAAEDIFEFTNAPGVSGYGLTRAPFVTELVRTPALEVFSLPYSALSSITAKWFTPKEAPIPQEPLSFTKEPQAYRVATESRLSFSKEYGALPTMLKLLPQQKVVEAVMQPRLMLTPEALAYRTLEQRFIITGMLLQGISISVATQKPMYTQETKQITQTRPLLAPLITPNLVTYRGQPYPQLQQQEMQISEDVLLYGYPTEQLLVSRQLQEPERKVTPIQIGLPLQVTPQKQQAIIVPLLNLSGFERGVFETTVPKTLNLLKKTSILTLPKTKLYANLTPGTLVLPRVSNIAGLKPQQIVTPKQKLKLTPETTTILEPKIPTSLNVNKPIPAYRNPLGNLGGAGRKGESGMTYLFGRQKRKYPVLTGPQAFKYLYPQGTKRKRK
jgi:hypothetical protein